MTYEALIQPTLWVASVGAAAAFLALALRARSRGAPTRRRLKGALLSGLIAALVVPAVGVVPPGHRGVVYDWGGGVSARERGEGLTLLVPWAQHLRTVSVRTQKVFSDKVFTQSLDLQEITVVASVNYHVEPREAAELFQEVGPLYRDTIVQPALFQRTKAAIGQVKAEDFALSRESLAETIQARLEEQLGGFGIVVEYVNIEDAIFDPDFVQAVKDKVIAEQEAAEQDRLIEAEAAIKEQAIIQAQARARSVEIEARAQADANKRIAESLTPAMLRWRWLEHWDGVLPKTLVGAATDSTLLLDARGEE
jgi:prohibitin 2